MDLTEAMGYRSDVIRRYFDHVVSWRDWPACFLLAIGAAALKPGKFRSGWAAWLLPNTISLRFKRFGERPVLLNPADGTHQLVLREFLFKKAYDLDRVPFVPALVIDCGAHIGLFLRLCHRRYPQTRLIAFEPQIGNAPLARRAAPANLLTMHQAAVGGEDGQVIFDDLALGGFGLIAKSSESSSRGAHSVPLLSLPRILSAAEDRLLLKIDIEGAERELLPQIASLLPPTCAIFLETHHFDAGWETAKSIFSAQGFSAQKLWGKGECIDGFFLRGATA